MQFQINSEVRMPEGCAPHVLKQGDKFSPAKGDR